MSLPVAAMRQSPGRQGERLCLKTDETLSTCSRIRVEPRICSSRFGASLEIGCESECKCRTGRASERFEPKRDDDADEDDDVDDVDDCDNYDDDDYDAYDDDDDDEEEGLTRNVE